MASDTNNQTKLAGVMDGVPTQVEDDVDSPAALTSGESTGIPSGPTIKNTMRVEQYKIFLRDELFRVKEEELQDAISTICRMAGMSRRDAEESVRGLISGTLKPTGIRVNATVECSDEFVQGLFQHVVTKSKKITWNCLFLSCPTSPSEEEEHFQVMKNFIRKLTEELHSESSNLEGSDGNRFGLRYVHNPNDIMAAMDDFFKEGVDGARASDAKLSFIVIQGHGCSDGLELRGDGNTKIFMKLNEIVDLTHKHWCDAVDSYENENHPVLCNLLLGCCHGYLYDQKKNCLLCDQKYSQCHNHERCSDSPATDEERCNRFKAVHFKNCCAPTTVSFEYAGTGWENRSLQDYAIDISCVLNKMITNKQAYLIEVDQSMPPSECKTEFSPSDEPMDSGVCSL